jgi:hypothetical protein
MIMLELYTLADRFLIPALGVCVNRAIIVNGDPKKYDHILPGSGEIAYAVYALPSSNPILDFFVDLYCVHWGWSEGEDIYDRDREWFSRLPKEFLIRYMVKIGRMRDLDELETNDTLLVDNCSYHGHTSDEERKACPHKVCEEEEETTLVTRYEALT